MAVSKEVFNQTVNEVIAQKKYYYLNNKVSDAAGSLLEKFKEWLEELLASHIDNIETVKRISGAASITIVVLFTAVVILIAVLVIRRIYKNRQGRKIDEILGEKITDETTPLTLLDKAKGYEQQANYRMSIRYSYIGLLLLMHERKLLYIEKSMTNTEIYNELVKNQYSALPQIKDLMDRFDYVWYGQNSYSQDEYIQYQAGYQALWNEVTKNEKNLKQ